MEVHVNIDHILDYDKFEMSYDVILCEKLFLGISPNMLNKAYHVENML